MASAEPSSLDELLELDDEDELLDDEDELLEDELLDDEDELLEDESLELDDEPPNGFRDDMVGDLLPSWVPPPPRGTPHHHPNGVPERDVVRLTAALASPFLKTNNTLSGSWSRKSCLTCTPP